MFAADVCKFETAPCSETYAMRKNVKRIPHSKELLDELLDERAACLFDICIGKTLEPMNDVHLIHRHRHARDRKSKGLL